MDIRVLYREIASVLDLRATPPRLKDLEPFRTDLNQVWKGVTTLSNGGWQVDSPWHAALVCVDLMAFAASGVLLDESNKHIKTLEQLKGIPACHYVFRGEGNHTYALCPAYFRAYNEAIRDELGRAINNFAALLKFASDRCFSTQHGMPNFPIQMFVGAAQHYLGNTPYMDWTTDPFVAIGFASNYPSKKEMSIVYALLSIRAVEKNAAFYLPPPFVERLYLQRGLFIETKTRAEDSVLQNSCISIQFKEDQEFRVLRNGQEIPDLMHPSDDLEQLAKYARKLAKEGVQIIDESVACIDEANATLQKHWDNIGGIPSFLSTERGEETTKLWFRSMVDMIDRFSHLKTDTGLARSQ